MTTPVVACLKAVRRSPFYQVQWRQFKETMSIVHVALARPQAFPPLANEAFRLKINGLRPAMCAGSRVAEDGSRHQYHPAHRAPARATDSSVTKVVCQSAVLTTVRRFVDRVFDIFIALHAQDPLTTSL
ncbi:hypothetical protein [Massilia psychrophila]|uniref:hypothetical protein n=1 Tax=Massilia psychrophila TaxID=1603353 RepID=UPI00118076F3|nr:hypothetical protein [Massilia psychrophila]